MLKRDSLTSCKKCLICTLNVQKISRSCSVDSIFRRVFLTKVFVCTAYAGLSVLQLPETALISSGNLRFLST